MGRLVRSTGILSFCLASVAAAAGAGPFALRPGVVVDPQRSVLYAMRPGGGVEALEVASGRVLWYAPDVAQPLLAAGDLVVALVDRPKAEAQDPTLPASVDVVLLNAGDGQRQRTLRVPLPEGVWSSIDDGPGRSLKVAASLNGTDLVLSWLAEENPLTGWAPGTGADKPAVRAAGVKRSGAARIDFASGRVQALPLDLAVAERLTRVEAAAEPPLPNVPGVQYLSADGRHVLASELIADDSVWEKYRWTIYSVPDRARIGELARAFPQAPFFVSGSTLVFEARPFIRRVDEKLVRQGLKLGAVDLTTNAEPWDRPLRDLAFYGPFPESLAVLPEEPAPGEPLPGTQAFGGTWRALGPAPKRVASGSTRAEPNNEVVGAIHTLAPHPTDANILYAGAVNGGIWRTANATATRPNWVQLTDPQLSLSIGALDMDPIDTTSQTLVAGIGRFSSFGRRGGARAGLLRTTNGGASWTALDGGGALTGKNITGVALRATRITVAVNAADIAGVPQLGIFRSTNAGATFTQISSGNGSATGLPFGTTHDVVRDPINPSRLFTGVVGADAFGGQNGVYRSTDGGATWAKVSSAAMDSLITSASTNNMEFAVGRSNNVFALIVNAGHLAGLFRSINGGTNWTSMDVPNLHPGGQGALHLSEAADPTNTSIVYIGGDTAMFRCNAAQGAGSQCVQLDELSTPAGGGTANNTTPHVDSREMAFDAAGNLLESDDGGVFRRTSPRNNQGDWFSIGNNLGAFEEHSMAYDTNANIAMGGFQDNGIGRELTPDQLTWDSINGGDGGDVAVDAISSPGLSSRYSSSQNLGGFRRQVYSAANVLQSQVSPALQVVGGPNPTFQFVTPLRVNNVVGQRLVIGASNGVYESLDQGETIRQVPPTLSVNGSGGHPLAYGATGNANVLYVGSGDTVRVRTAAAPASLVQSASYPGTGTGRTVLDLAVDPTHPNTVFVVDSTTVYLSQNAGTSWTDITGNLLSLGPGSLRSVVHVQNASGEAVAVGTNNGVFAALASGGFSSWQALGSAFPRALAFDLDYVRGRDLLVAGTLGRGTWVLPQPSFGGATTVFSATFDADANGFTYVDDAFGTAQPAYATGTFVNPGGFSGGGLRVVVGGVDTSDVLNMSGGWRRSFSLPSAQLASLSFDFNMTQTTFYESDEFTDMLSQIDGQAAAVQAHLVGDGDAGPPLSTGNVSRVLNLGCLAAGSHTVTLGQRNNKKTASNESTTLLLDNVTVTTTGPCP